MAKPRDVLAQAGGSAVGGLLVALVARFGAGDEDWRWWLFPPVAAAASLLGLATRKWLGPSAG